MVPGERIQRWYITFLMSHHVVYSFGPLRPPATWAFPGYHPQPLSDLSHPGHLAWCLCGSYMEALSVDK